MKNILKILFLLLTITSNSQIINIKDDNGIIVPGAYYKDVDSVLDAFEGTWLYTNGNISLKILLVKKVGHYNGLYTDDFICGGYEYKINNQVLITTLSDATANYTAKLRYSILGNYVLKNNYVPICTDCVPGENRLNLSFSEHKLYGNLIIKKTIINGQDAINIDLMISPSYYHTNSPPPPSDFTVPSGIYTLIKQ